jgi:hypothetical protein
MVYWCSMNPGDPVYPGWSTIRGISGQGFLQGTIMRLGLWGKSMAGGVLLACMGREWIINQTCARTRRVGCTHTAFACLHHTANTATATMFYSLYKPFKRHRTSV